MKNKAFFSVIVASVLGGAVPVLIKSTISVIPPLTLAFLRFFIAFIFFLPFIIRCPFYHQGLKSAVIVGIVGSANIILFVFGIRSTIPTITQTMYSGAPVIVALLSFFLLNEKFTTRKITGVVVGFIGVLFIVLVPSLSGLNLENVTLSGNMIVLLAVISHSAYLVFSKKLSKHYSPMQLTFIFIVVTMVISFMGIPGEMNSYNGWWKNVRLSHIFSLIYLGVIGTSILYFLFQYAIKHGSPLISSLSLYLLPISTYFWAYFLLKEYITMQVISGAVLVLLGAWLVNSTDKIQIEDSQSIALK